MKRIFSLVFSLIVALPALAQSDDYMAMLRLRLSDRSPVAVRLNGRFISRQTTSLTLAGMRPGRHYLDVYSTDAAGRRAVRIYSGMIRVAPGTENIAIVDVDRRALRMRTQGLADVSDDRNRRNHDIDTRYDDRRDDEENDSVRGDRDHDNEAYGDRDKERQDDIRDGEDAGSRPGYGAYPRGRENTADGRSNIRFSAQDMTELQAQVKGRITDSEKERLLKTELAAQTITTAQVREMLGWLAFESTRLEIAKWAYTRVSDPTRYKSLEDMFSFSASKEEFRQAIRR